MFGVCYDQNEQNATNQNNKHRNQNGFVMPTLECVQNISCCFFVSDMCIVKGDKRKEKRFIFVFVGFVFVYKIQEKKVENERNLHK